MVYVVDFVVVTGNETSLSTDRLDHREYVVAFFRWLAALAFLRHLILLAQRQ